MGAELPTLITRHFSSHASRRVVRQHQLKQLSYLLYMFHLFLCLKSSIAPVLASISYRVFGSCFIYYEKHVNPLDGFFHIIRGRVLMYKSSLDEELAGAAAVS